VKEGEAGPELVSFDKLIQALEAQQKGWEPVELP